MPSYTYHSQGPATLKDAIFSALSILIHKHPILSAIPVDEDTSHPYFARLTSINLLDALTFMSRQMPLQENERDVELDEILEVQHNTPFKRNYGSVPFWRVIILTNPFTETEFVACFIFHHALGDSTSGIAFHNDFLSALQAGPAPFPSSIIYPPKTNLLPVKTSREQFSSYSRTLHELRDIVYRANVWQLMKHVSEL
jgi:hypothetical protein